MLCITALCLVCASPIVAQIDVPSKLGPFQEIPRISNPLRDPFNFNSTPTPVAVDMDGDGKKDIVLADYYGAEGFHYLHNVSTASTIQFTRIQYWNNPFEYGTFPLGSTPAFTDMDGDNDPDMLLGAEDGTFRYYRRNAEYTNPFSPQTGAWNSATKAGNPMNGIDLGSFTSPVFNDFDNDGDNDLIIGSSYLPANKSIHYFINDGHGNFTPGALSGINPNLAQVTPSLLDVDDDGDNDIVIGAADGNLYYFKRVGETSFEEQTGPNNPFSGINRGIGSSPTTADFDNDGDDDLIFGAQNIDLDIFYLENKGAGVFEEKVSFDNPFGGVAVRSDSSPYLTDLDNDGDLDIIIGNSQHYMKYLRNDNGSFVELSSHPFSGLTVTDLFTPSFVDIDGDGDKDMVGSVHNGTTSLVYFKNDGGTFVEQPAGTLYSGSISTEEGHADFADIDNDGDYDFFISDGFSSWELSYTFVRFFKNTGTPQTPVFTEMTGAQNPLNQVEEEFVLLPRLLDIDHDGDLDAVIGEGGDVIEISDGNEFSYYENIGTPDAPNFRYRGDLMPQGDNPFEPAPAFGDFDNDGDLDIFVGDNRGKISYYQNTNYPAVTQMTAEPLTVTVGAAATTIDALLTISDPDNDSIVFAEVIVEAYVPAQDELTFSTIPKIAVSHNTSTGVLTFRGKASIAEYQEVLRTVKFRTIAEPSSGRAKSGPLAVTSRIVTFRVVDADGTNTTAASRTLNLITGQPPVFNDHAVSVAATHAIDIDLTTLITDPDNDIDLTTLTIVHQPNSGAVTAISSSGLLTVNYNGLAFAGTETMTVRVCDADNSCDENTIAITVTNSSPVFTDHSVALPYAEQTSIDVSALISDNEN
ncbi:MAG TPA: FG-GAP-like repeat-containing protein, partial [Chryseosolibacter sp.]|nr:FG-GAP-like repeat-containing protein [Chryseosolibacter sp.]